MEHSESASSRWARIIHEQQAGGFSIASFCRRRKLSQASFYAWRSRLRLSEAGGPAFVEVKVKASVAGSALELLLPGGSRVLLHHGFDRQLLREVLSARRPNTQPTCKPFSRRCLFACRWWRFGPL